MRRLGRLGYRQATFDQDTRQATASRETLFSTRYGLETAQELVPVELKSTAAPPQGPYDNHVAQLMGYCLLVEDSMGRPVPEGILRYRHGEVRIPFTNERREWVIGIIAAMREAQAGRPVGRSHNLANKCRGCSVRAGCSEAL